jgi:energy-coupling factor transporter ATP-binding protein EcfA2
MRLSFFQPHISITSLVDGGIELGNLTVISGLNGSGKSQFLQAIANGSISNDVANLQMNEIWMRDWSSFTVPDVGVSVAPDTRESRVAAFKLFKGRFPNGSPLKIEALRLGLDLPSNSTESEIINLCNAELTKHSDDLVRQQSIYNQLLQFRMNLHPGSGLGMAMFQAQGVLRFLSERLGKDIHDLTIEDVDKDILTTSNMAPFQMTFANMFDEYRVFFIDNLVAGRRIERGHPTKSLTDEEFENEHGRPPWDILNEALDDARMHFTINSPDLNNARASYTPKLTKRGTEIEIPFSSLSSGERILMSLAICVYYYKDDRLQPIYPKLILLDEVDAPLHPSMCRDMLKIIQNTLVKKLGLHVIMTTHSPSTVALAPDDSIHIMTSDGDRLRKATKAEALNLLTDGVPTLAINFEGRRQVLVESPSDAAICAELYNLFKSELPSERSLEFISLGFKNSESGSDENTGVDKVLSVLTSLIDAGNQSVFALVDSDRILRAPDPNKRMQVFAKGGRDGLENCIYDPLVLLLTIARRAPAEISNLNISQTFVDTNISNLSESEIQEQLET